MFLSFHKNGQKLWQTLNRMHILQSKLLWKFWHYGQKFHFLMVKQKSKNVSLKPSKQNSLNRPNPTASFPLSLSFPPSASLISFATAHLLRSFFLLLFLAFISDGCEHWMKGGERAEEKGEGASGCCVAHARMSSKGPLKLGH